VEPAIAAVLAVDAACTNLQRNDLPGYDIEAIAIDQGPATASLRSSAAGNRRNLS
jgi:hypothetical protein